MRLAQLCATGIWLGYRATPGLRVHALCQPSAQGFDLVMSFAKTVRHRRAAARANRVMERAITEAASSAMRDELIIAAQRAGLR